MAMSFIKTVLSSIKGNIQWVKFILPIFTTFLGAWFAFLWQNRINSEKQKQANYSVLLKTQALFYAYFEAIYSIKNELDPYVKDPERTTKVKHISFCHKFPELDFEGLSFILATKSPDLFADIISAYRKCASTIEAVDERNTQYRKICGVDTKTDNPEDGKFQVHINPSDLKFLIDFTDIMYQETEQVLVRIQQIDTKLQQFIKSNFKGKHALKAGLI
jgi:hypothetical protein